MNIKNWKEEWGIPRDNKIPTQVKTPQVVKTGNVPATIKSSLGTYQGELIDRDTPKTILDMRQKVKDATRARRKTLRAENRLIK